MRTAALVALALVLAPAAVPAQGLGDAAAREKKKRTQGSAPAAKKVFTDADLPSPTAPPPAGDPAKAEPAAKARDEAKDTDSDAAKTAANEDPLEADRRERQRLEADWRVRFANARERLALAEAGAWREVVRTEFYQGVPVQMKVREKVETLELVAARQAMADLEEEFRRTGLPPGWARQP